MKYRKLVWNVFLSIVSIDLPSVEDKNATPLVCWQDDDALGFKISKPLFSGWQKLERGFTLILICSASAFVNLFFFVVMINYRQLLQRIGKSWFLA